MTLESINKTAGTIANIATPAAFACAANCGPHATAVLGAIAGLATATEMTTDVMLGKYADAAKTGTKAAAIEVAVSLAKKKAKSVGVTPENIGKIGNLLDSGLGLPGSLKGLADSAAEEYGNAHSQQSQ